MVQLGAGAPLWFFVVSALSLSRHQRPAQGLSGLRLTTSNTDENVRIHSATIGCAPFTTGYNGESTMKPTAMAGG
uniref:Secreted protein n=1 Tax=Oryza nivara TaxID=4536 RepID=A0A0E0I9A5_ORYNI